MKRFNLSAQLLILITSILVITSILFSALVFNKIDGMSESTTLDNLSSIVSATKEYWNDTSNTDEFALEQNENMQVAFVRLIPKNTIPSEGGMGPRENNYTIYKSDNVEAILGASDENSLRPLFSVAFNTGSGSLKKNVNNKKLYVAYETSSDNVSFIVFTNSTYANAIRRRWTLDIAYIFIAVILLALVIIYIWSQYYKSRLFRVTTHVRNLDKNNYEGSYIDDGRDELAELTNSIEDMRIILKESENVKKEMLQNVSHDFKTPTSVIRGYAEAIRDGVETPDAANVIIEQADILYSKIEKLLQYNKLEYLTKDKDFEPISMKNVIENVCLNYKNLKGIELICDLDDSVFYGYEENYYIVVDNFLENAKRYAKTKIVITLKKGILKFYNDGDHIDDKFINNVFRAYEKGSKGKFGLGMSIVQRTLSFFDYEMKVENKDIGCEFTIKKKSNQNANQL